MEKASQFHDKGYNCAESILKMANDQKKLNIPVSIASPFGTGMTVGATCGAVTGILMALGSVKGRESSDEPNKTRASAKEIMNKIKEKYGTVECADLKKNGVKCNEIIDYAYSILKEYI